MLNRGSGVGTARLTGTAVLAALVIVFDYALKFSGLKIPFPWMPFLKFDFTGVPIILSYLLFGASSAASTSLIACLGIVARSGDLVGGSMKALAEFSTVTGMVIGHRVTGPSNKVASIRGLIVFASALLSRVLAMSLFNLVVLPRYHGIPFNVVVGMLPILGLFNGMQGALTVGLGQILYTAYRKRFPSPPT
jgi:riboflavin transporter FmnP